MFLVVTRFDNLKMELEGFKIALEICTLHQITQALHAKTISEQKLFLKVQDLTKFRLEVNFALFFM